MTSFEIMTSPVTFPTNELRLIIVFFWNKQAAVGIYRNSNHCMLPASLEAAAAADLNTETNMDCILCVSADKETFFWTSKKRKSTDIVH